MGAADPNRIAIVTLPHVHWTDGTIFDLVAIGRRAREVGAALVVDGTQSAGALPLDVSEIQPDALIEALPSAAAPRRRARAITGRTSHNG